MQPVMREYTVAFENVAWSRETWKNQLQVTCAGLAPRGQIRRSRTPACHIHSRQVPGDRWPVTERQSQCSLSKRDILPKCAACSNWKESAYSKDSVFPFFGVKILLMEKHTWTADTKWAMILWKWVLVSCHCRTNQPRARRGHNLLNQTRRHRLSDRRWKLRTLRLRCWNVDNRGTKRKNR